MEYHSQYGQDKWIDDNIFCGLERGVFLEAGADDGVRLSNTYFFEKYRYWTGICIEPRQEEFFKLQKNRTCICECCALSDKPGQRDFILAKGYGAGLSGLKEKADPAHMKRLKGCVKKHKGTMQETKVVAKLLSQLLVDSNIHHIDLFSLDIEGGELDVIKTFDFSVCSVNVFLIENEYGDIKLLRDWMRAVGYDFIQRLTIDDVFVRKGVSYASDKSC